jgi:CTP-dependent riboflavin kinase
METWTPLFRSIIESSVWCESKETKLVWITLLALKDRNGYVGAALPALAKHAGVSVQECAAALKVLESPDPYSRTKTNGGRRIQTVAGGWNILNHFLHRGKMSAEYRREYKRMKEREYRLRNKAQVVKDHHAAGDELREEPSKYGNGEQI